MGSGSAQTPIAKARRHQASPSGKAELSGVQSRLLSTDCPLSHGVRNAPGPICQGSARSVPEWGVPPSPSFPREFVIC
jgi:hypothetical protein